MDIVKIVEEKMGQNTYVVIEEETETAVAWWFHRFNWSGRKLLWADIGSSGKGSF